MVSPLLNILGSPLSWTNLFTFINHTNGYYPWSFIINRRKITIIHHWAETSASEVGASNPCLDEWSFSPNDGGNIDGRCVDPCRDDVDGKGGESEVSSYDGLPWLWTVTRWRGSIAQFHWTTYWGMEERFRTHLRGLAQKRGQRIAEIRPRVLPTCVVLVSFEWKTGHSWSSLILFDRWVNVNSNDG